MAQATPKTISQWNVSEITAGSFDGLKFSTSESIDQLGDNEVLVKLAGASLNYRDLLIVWGQYPFWTAPNVIPGSDGAGTVVSVGSRVTRWKAGDNVVLLFDQKHIGGPNTDEFIRSGTGGPVDGTFRQYGAFNEEALVRMPSNLSFIEAATLTCAGLTAWNALFGPDQRSLFPGQWVLTQGTGGVSLFAVQFAKAAGAKVIATTSSDAKAAVLRRLGADHIINYKSTPEWGKAARQLTPGGRGVDKVIEVGGPVSVGQSLEATARNGYITIIGFVGSTSGGPSYLEILTRGCTVNHVTVGDRHTMEEMCRAIEGAGDSLKPVVDAKLFKLSDLKQAYEYVQAQQHIGKVCIEID